MFNLKIFKFQKPSPGKSESLLPGQPERAAYLKTPGCFSIAVKIFYQQYNVTEQEREVIRRIFSKVL